MATGYEQGYGRQGRPEFGEAAARRPVRDWDTGRHRLPAVLRAPLEGRTWRAICYVFLSLPISIFTFVCAVTFLALGAALLITFLGLPVLAMGLAFHRGFGALERQRARGLLGLNVTPPTPVRSRERSLTARMTALLKDSAAWRHVLYSLLHLPWAVFAFGICAVFVSYGWAMLTYPLWQWVFPLYVGTGGVQLYGDGSHSVYLDSAFEIALTSLLGLVITLVTPWIVRALTTVDRMMVLGLLGGSRAETPGPAHHVGPRLYGGIPEARSRPAPAPVDRPAALAHHGLHAALTSLAADCAVPVQVDVDLPARPAPVIEDLAYTTACELLANVSRHARASAATVDVWRSEDRLMLQVTDDGVGGAQPTAGSGLAVLTEQLAAVDGLLMLDSPKAGPTRATVELPWRDRAAA